MENGIYFDLSHSAYHAITERVSNSYLSRIAICPAAAKVPQTETQFMVFGRAFHVFVLDGVTAFSKEVSVIPSLNMRTNAGKEEDRIFREAHKGKIIINEEEMTNILEMDEAIKHHPLAKELIGSGTSEVSVFWADPFSGLPCKARPDKSPGQKTLVDLKKTRDASPNGFQRAILNFGYHRQAAFYLDGMNYTSQDEYDLFAYVAVEDKKPYRTEVYTISQDFINYGRTEYRILINTENECRMINSWRNYSNPQAVEIDLPSYLRRNS